MLAAIDGRTAIGFIAVKPQTRAAFEAYILGVRRDFHRRGIGRALFAAVEAFAIERNAQFLTVKTVAVENPDPHYGATRAFYEAIGFQPLEVFPTLWDAHNPCLLMVKALEQR